MEDELAYVKNSKYRVKALMSLDGKVKMPSQIARDEKIFQNHISNTLRQLRLHGLIECINPEVKRGRLYRLTDNEEKIVKILNSE